MFKVLLIAISLALVLAACASPQDSVAGGSDVVIPDTLVAPVDLARSDLGLVLGSEDGIVVVLAEEVIWPDGSLGCPQPGIAYTQALVDGYRIELGDGDTTYAYHGAVGRDPFRCDNVPEPAATGDAAPGGTSPPAVVGEGSDSDVDDVTASTYEGPLADLVATATADLAARLSASTDDVVVVSADGVVWPDGSIGCPTPDMMYTQVQVDGARIVLSVDGGTYAYHSGGSRGLFLCVPTKASGDATTGLTLPGTTIPGE